MSLEGTVTAYNEAHRCGVIHCDDDDSDLRVEPRDLDASGLDHLTRNCRVSFDRAIDAEGRIHAQRITQLQDPKIVAGRSNMSMERLHDAGFKSIF
ncbi:cold shock domain-containing protein [Sphingomicrobium astaxanthinifaciens]|uniref:cold shock domain-containing protein n=1 Tax=Sphingomicrobium astaxanthinifaciens TaxID=1227949 RepID=UPI001FCA51D4|nr:cold shock domain-containing protein [Sphingomicrobium astaxanthinifaciens]MCJ7421933.1 cold shock domain-containing protein [Sphingomicrobium astaxanthinifaciens]